MHRLHYLLACRQAKDAVCRRWLRVKADDTHLRPPFAAPGVAVEASALIPFGTKVAALATSLVFVPAAAPAPRPEPRPPPAAPVRVSRATGQLPWIPTAEPVEAAPQAPAACSCVRHAPGTNGCALTESEVSFGPAGAAAAGAFTPEGTKGAALTLLAREDAPSSWLIPERPRQHPTCRCSPSSHG
jgi:hypothetical protein